MLGRIRKELKSNNYKLDELKWLFSYHMGVVTEHFRVWFEEYFFQPLEMSWIKKKMNHSDQRTTYPISFVERLRHNVHTVCHETVKAK